MTTGYPPPATRSAFGPLRGRGRPAYGLLRQAATHRVVREIGLLLVAWFAYSASRLIADDNVATAQDRARSVLDVETRAHLDIESWLNHAVSPIAWIGVSMSFWYALLHYVVTPAVLVFVFVTRRPDYSRARNALLIGSALGLLAYLLVPTAPPRLMSGGGYLDTLADYAQYGWWSDHASAPAGLGSLTNELAAMPSLHVGWTVWVAWALWPSVGRLGRTLTCLYAAGTTFVVLATGNHWVLDAIGGAAVIAVGIVVSGRIAARPRPITRARA
jgi:PAP2 superfamily